MQVFLNVYDISPYNFYFAWAGLGAFHSGVEVDGTEYSFGGIVGGGSAVYSVPPKSEVGVGLRDSIFLGTLHCTRDELRQVIANLKAEFEAKNYNLLRRNCNDFSNALCNALLHRPIPSFINRAARVGQCFSCLLPASMASRPDDCSKLLSSPQPTYTSVLEVPKYPRSLSASYKEV
jgi:hypothetical protein